ncbi:MAG TPA: hypothetical protein VK612_03170, partial [Pyrinomonadaceae bacterium]|nr:hypothetical protein [Pyrinomonadaceae bacterium]
MNRAFLIFIFVIIAYAGFVHAQNGPAEPRPILVDVITSHSKVRETRGSPVNNSVGSANETEARAFELMNAQRIVSGLKTLQWDDG